MPEHLKYDNIGLEKVVVMKHGLSSVVAVLISLIIPVAGCSVKEDRGDCPCRLVIDFSGAGCDDTQIISVDVTSADGYLFHDSMDAAGLREREYAVDVPRKVLDVNVHTGDGGFYRPAEGLIIPEGEQCPAIHIFSAEVDARTEYCECAPVLHKNYCRVTLNFRYEDGSFPFLVRIAGNVSGYDVSGSPLSGDFIYSPEIDSGGSCSVRLPRQTDASLVLEIVEDDSVIRQFALGHLIIDSGYDWTAPDLQDIKVDIDYSKSDIIFSVDGWDKEMSFDVTI